MYGRIAAWRTAAEGPGASHEVMGFDTPTWRWCMCGVGVFMALVHPFGQLLMDDGCVTLCGAARCVWGPWVMGGGGVMGAWGSAG